VFRKEEAKLVIYARSQGCCVTLNLRSHINLLLIEQQCSFPVVIVIPVLVVPLVVVVVVVVVVEVVAVIIIIIVVLVAIELTWMQ